MSDYLYKTRLRIITYLTCSIFFAYGSLGAFIFLGKPYLGYNLFGLSLFLMLVAITGLKVLEQNPMISSAEIKKALSKSQITLDSAIWDSGLLDVKEVSALQLLAYVKGNNKNERRTESSKGGHGGSSNEKPSSEAVVEVSEVTSKKKKKSPLSDVPEELKGTHEGVALKQIFETDIPLRVPYYIADSKAYFMRISEDKSIFLGTKDLADLPEKLQYDITKGKYSVQRVVKERFFDLVAEASDKES